MHGDVDASYYIIREREREILSLGGEGKRGQEKAINKQILGYLGFVLWFLFYRKMLLARKK